MEAPENSRPKGTTKGRKINHDSKNTGRRTRRKAKKKKERKERRESSESSKTLAVKVIHLQCREADKQNGNISP